MARFRDTARSEGSSRRGPIFIYPRHETKYELDARAAQRLRELVGRHLPLYEFNPGHPCTYITTIYFDNDRLDFYRRARTSYDDNVKVRVKEYYYNSGGELEVFPYCFVEVKQRTEGRVEKRRVRLPKQLLDPLVRGKDVWPDLVRGDPGLEFDEVREVYGELRRYLSVCRLRPRAIIHYRRTVHQLDENELRVTFDDQLKIFPPVKGLYRAADALTEERLGRPSCSIDRVILEIKSRAGYPQWLSDGLRETLPRRFSKFTTSMCALRQRGSSRAPSPDGNGHSVGSSRAVDDLEDTREERVLR